ITAGSFVSQGVDLGAAVGGLTSEIDNLNNRVTHLEANQGQGSTGLVDADGNPVDFNNLAVGDLTVDLDLIVKGALTINGPSTFNGTALFQGDTTFNGHVTFN